MEPILPRGFSDPELQMAQVLAMEGWQGALPT